MDFSLSDEQRMLADSVARVIRDRHDFPAWRRVAMGEAEPDAALWREMAALGWLGILVPERCGGLGGSAVDMMVLMEGLGRGLLADPVVETAVIGATLLARAPASRDALLQAIAGGTCRLALAAIERGQRFNLRRPETTAARQGGGWVLNGQKSFVPAASSATHLAVTAQASDGFALFLLPADAPGLLRADFVGMDGRRVSSLALQSVAMPDEALLASGAEAEALFELALDHGIAALCAEAVGAMDFVQQTTLAYLRERRQFGRPLAQFQVLQHRVADLYVACEEARSLMLLATLRLDAPRRDRTRAVSAAKARVGELGRWVAHQSIQLHGAMGMCEEVEVGHHARRLMMIDTLFGDTAHHRRRFATAA